jgi:conflict system pore-forming effector with SLATT domain
MSERNEDFLRFYEEYRIRDQIRFYTQRLDEFDRALGQGLFVSATILGFASGAGALAGTTLGWAKGWAAVAAILSALSTALAGYIALYAFGQQSKIYGDALRAVRFASRPTPDPDLPQSGRTPEQNIAEMVNQVEQALRREQSQWGQLTSQIQTGDQPAG